ncbi:hypothetical protein BDN67DRAFT_986149 [Paxillus ammoniavirescens]|nr:hypothetical protein BDN67DRAFT_986149 [Paxillus ammoniavirescens]
MSRTFRTDETRPPNSCLPESNCHHTSLWGPTGTWYQCGGDFRLGVHRPIIAEQNASPRPPMMTATPHRRSAIDESLLNPWGTPSVVEPSCLNTSQHSSSSATGQMTQCSSFGKPCFSYTRLLPGPMDQLCWLPTLAGSLEHSTLPTSISKQTRDESENREISSSSLSECQNNQKSRVLADCVIAFGKTLKVTSFALPQRSAGCESSDSCSTTSTPSTSLPLAWVRVLVNRVQSGMEENRAMGDPRRPRVENVATNGIVASATNRRARVNTIDRGVSELKFLNESIGKGQKFKRKMVPEKGADARSQTAQWIEFTAPPSPSSTPSN